jgi:hypothetical protein
MIRLLSVMSMPRIHSLSGQRAGEHIVLTLVDGEPFFEQFLDLQLLVRPLDVAAAR